MRNKAILQKVLLMILLLAVTTSVTAQKQKVHDCVKVDDCAWLINYNYFCKDTVINESITIKMVLQVGETYQYFLPENIYLFQKEVWHRGNMMEINEAGNLFFSRPVSILERWMRNRDNNDIEQGGSLSFLSYQLIDKDVSQDWNMEYADTMTVCGYLCRKATCTFRNRNWTAWYAPELTMDAGPWKLAGLPGIILQAEDDENLILFQATNVQQGDEYPIEKEIWPKSYRKISREKYLELECMSALEPNEFRKLVSRRDDSSDNTIHFSRQFYCPLEKE